MKDKKMRELKIQFGKEIQNTNYRNKKSGFSHASPDIFLKIIVFFLDNFDFVTVRICHKEILVRIRSEASDF